MFPGACNRASVVVFECTMPSSAAVDPELRPLPTGFETGAPNSLNLSWSHILAAENLRIAQKLRQRVIELRDVSVASCIGILLVKLVVIVIVLSQRKLHIPTTK